MEGKTVILSVLIMSLVMAHIQVEAKICCPTKTSRNAFTICRLASGSKAQCASLSGCKIISDNTSCPSGYPYGNLDNSGVSVNEYCKFGCVSSACGAMNALQNSDASDIVNGAEDQCAKACSTFCTKGFTGVKTA